MVLLLGKQSLALPTTSMFCKETPMTRRHLPGAQGSAPSQPIPELIVHLSFRHIPIVRSGFHIPMAVNFAFRILRSMYFCALFQATLR